VGFSFPLLPPPRHRWRPRLALPPAVNTLRELRAARGLLGGGGALAGPQAAAGGTPVLLVPGFLAGDRSLMPLARAITTAGYDAFPARIARNIDCSEATAQRLLCRLEAIASDHGRPVAVIGHSRGGMLARVAARRRPDLVSGVIAIGTPQLEPLAMHPVLLAHTLVLACAGNLGIRGLVRWSCAAGGCCAAFRADLAAPIAADLDYLSIYSRRDGIVDWRACVDPMGRHFEVAAGHCGMAADHGTVGAVISALQRLSPSAS
jgi:triacylglycerol lipase